MELPLHPYAVLLAEDQAVVRNGTSYIYLLQNHIPLNALYQATDGMKVIEKLQLYPVDILLLDDTVPFSDMEACLNIVRSEFPQIKIIVLSRMKHVADMLKMIQCGAQGFLVKNFNEEQLEAALQSICKNRWYFDRHFADQALSNVANGSGNESRFFAELTPPERQTLIRVCYEKFSGLQTESGQSASVYMEKELWELFSKIRCNGMREVICYCLQGGIVRIRDLQRNMESDKKQESLLYRPHQIPVCMHDKRNGI